MQGCSGGYIGIIGDRNELYWGYIGIVEKKMETIGIIGVIDGLVLWVKAFGFAGEGLFTVFKISEPGLRICACRLGISLAQRPISKTSNRVQGSLERNIEAM